MPASKKALSPTSRAKADKRNGRDKANRAAKAVASGGTKSGNERKATTDLAEEEMPASSGGSWKRSGELMWALVDEKQKGHPWPQRSWSGRKRKWRSTSYKRALGDTERALGLNNGYVEYLEWDDAEKNKEKQGAGKEISRCARSEHKGVRRGPARSG
jgi:hypothetical protein